MLSLVNCENPKRGKEQTGGEADKMEHDCTSLWLILACQEKKPGFLPWDKHLSLVTFAVSKIIGQMSCTASQVDKILQSIFDTGT